MASLTFHPASKVIRVVAPDTEVTVQELINAIADWLDEPGFLDIDWFAEWAGNVSLGGSPETFTEPVLVLVDDWRLEFEARGGPDYESCVVKDGTFVAANIYGNNPIKPSAFTQVQIRQSVSGALLDAEEMRKILQNPAITRRSTGKMEILDDDDSVFLSGDIWEDEAGTVPYRGDGIERRGKLEKP